MNNVPTLDEMLSRLFSTLPIVLILGLMILTIAWAIKMSRKEKRVLALHERLRYLVSPEGLNDRSGEAEGDRRKYRDTLAVLATQAKGQR
jgi:hypothetical protein